MPLKIRHWHKIKIWLRGHLDKLVFEVPLGADLPLLQLALRFSRKSRCDVCLIRDKICQNRNPNPIEIGQNNVTCHRCSFLTSLVQGKGLPPEKSDTPTTPSSHGNHLAGTHHDPGHIQRCHLYLVTP